jgi:hypothetical protein
MTLHTFAPYQHLDTASLNNLTLHNEGRAFDPTSLSWDLHVQLIVFSSQLYFDSLKTANEVKKWLAQYPGCEKFIKVFASKDRHHGALIKGLHLGKILDREVLGQEEFGLAL